MFGDPLASCSGIVQQAAQGRLSGHKGSVISPSPETQATGPGAPSTGGQSSHSHPLGDVGVPPPHKWCGAVGKHTEGSRGEWERSEAALWVMHTDPWPDPCHLPPLSSPPSSCKGYAHPGDEVSEAQRGQASCPGSHSQLGGARVGPVTSVVGGVHAFFPSGSLGLGPTPLELRSFCSQVCPLGRTWETSSGLGSGHQWGSWAGGVEGPRGRRAGASSQRGAGPGGEGRKLLVSLGLSIVCRHLFLVQMERRERGGGTWGPVSCPLTSRSSPRRHRP